MLSYSYLLRVRGLSMADSGFIAAATGAAHQAQEEQRQRQEANGLPVERNPFFEQKCLAVKILEQSVVRDFLEKIPPDDKGRRFIDDEDYASFRHGFVVRYENPDLPRSVNRQHGLQEEMAVCVEVPSDEHPSGRIVVNMGGRFAATPGYPGAPQEIILASVEELEVQLGKWAGTVASGYFSDPAVRKAHADASLPQNKVTAPSRA